MRPGATVKQYGTVRLRRLSLPVLLACCTLALTSYILVDSCHFPRDQVRSSCRRPTWSSEMKTSAAAKRRLCQPGEDTDNVGIDAEFAGLIPPLTASELAELHRSLDDEGCRDALVVWQGKN